MVQNTFPFYNLDELDELINRISQDANYKDASSVLMQLYNPRLDMNEELIVAKLNEAFPNACISGMTAANLAENHFDISSHPVELSVTYFFNTTLIQYEFDMEDTTPFISGRLMSEYLDSLENVRCLQIFYTSISTSFSAFIKEFNHHHIPIFGAKAGRSLQRKNIAHAYGKKVYANGFVVTAFISDSLRIFMDNNIGWQPIGVEMVVTQTANDTIISEIDKKPAIDIYPKYLKVHANKYFVENVCEFPLMFERDRLKIARVPMGYTEDGSIILTSAVNKGEHFRLSYANKELIFSLSEQSAEDIKLFEPEALFIFECGNRLRFLKEDAVKELDLYRKCGVDFSVVPGYAELFVTSEGIGCDLNSALVAVGLKEDASASDVIVPCRTPKIEEDTFDDSNKEIPFLDRILTFLESTSKELDSMNKELGKIAYTDQLTKIYNRWELGRKIDEFLELNKHGKSYGLLFLDIDHFKHINDTYGHDVGDVTLQSVVTLIKDNLKDGHAFGRWGGEEFVYLIPDVDEESLLTFAESIRKNIDETCFVPVQHITISIGVTMAKPDDTLETFVKRADEAVYEAKETGRNKVVLH